MSVCQEKEQGENTIDGQYSNSKKIFIITFVQNQDFDFETGKDRDGCVVIFECEYKESKR